MASFTARTPEFRFLFPNVIEPKAFVENGKPKGEPAYGLSGLIPVASDITELKAAALACAKAKWPGLENYGKSVKFPFRSGDGEADRVLAKAKDAGKEKPESHVAFYRGNVMFRTSPSQFQPQVIDRAGKDILVARDVYSGAWGVAEVNFVATLHVATGDKMVKMYANRIIKMRDGNRIASGRDAKEAFKDLLGGTSAKDPTVGDDDIPF
jgi:hypothetical protein